MTEPAAEQLPLLAAPPRRTRRPRGGPDRSVDLPVAQVWIETAVPHLDRIFDYSVPAALHEAAQPGVRCTVPMAGRQVSGFIVGRAADSEHGGLRPLHRINSGLPVLTPEVLRLAQRVAAEQAGTVSDVLRLAVPPRHARTEKAVLAAPALLPDPPIRPPSRAWSAHRGGTALLDRVAAGAAPRAVWTALPAVGEEGWPTALAVAALTAASAGRGSLIVLPDHRDVQRVLAEFSGLDADSLVARLTADLGPGARYRAFLRVLRGERPIVVGTRAAAFAPVPRLGLVICWDDGDDLLLEPRAPYPHARDILVLRAEASGAAAVFGGLARSAWAQRLVETGWAREVAADRAVVRRVAPRVLASGDDDLRDPAARTARIPSMALRTVREALAAGPVLVQVPHAGYVPGLACQDCRRPARCAHCGGPLTLTTRSGSAACSWCGRQVVVGAGPTPTGRPGAPAERHLGPSATWDPAISRTWRCGHCDSPRLRAVRVGSDRTAEEIGRAFPGVRVRVSSAERGVLGAEQLQTDPDGIVVATPGAEPVAPQGFSSALLLDGWVALSRPSVDAALEALRRWCAAAALVRPAGQGGRVLVVAEAAHPAVQALVRWDPAWLAGRELAERVELGLPPAGVLAEAVGVDLPEFLRTVDLPDGVEVIGPLPQRLDGGGAGSGERLEGLDGAATRILLRAPSALRLPLAQALAAGRRVSSARKLALPRVRMHAESW